jgi:hypothetical protein
MKEGLVLKTADWNSSLIILQLLKVIQPRPLSLWAKWILNTSLKDKNFWYASTPSNASWIWRKVLKLRSKVLPFLTYKLGNGSFFSLWYDPWLHGHSINPNPYLLLNSGLDRRARVSALIHDLNWVPPDSFHDEVLSFNQLLANAPSPSLEDDSISWDGLDISKVKASNIWESIRHKASKLSWASLVWFKLYVPRFSFISSLACLHRLPTKERVSSFDPAVDVTCGLCSSAMEDQNHLFFSCSYSTQVVAIVFAKAGCSTFPLDWDAALHFLETFVADRLVMDFLKLLFTTTIYRIWHARNKKLHEDFLIPPSVNAREIVSLVKSRLVSSLKFRSMASKFHILRDWI